MVPLGLGVRNAHCVSHPDRRTDLYAVPPRHRSLWNDPDISKLDFLNWTEKTSIHFYGSWFRRIFKGRDINPGSLVDTLLRKHGIDPNDHPI